MARGPRYSVAFRRRREGKTNYRRRKALVLSGLPRLVVRCTLRRVIAQMVRAEIVGDRVLASADSGELARKYGWLGSCANVPAAYLTGLLCGFKALRSGVKEAVLDIGLRSPTRGSRVFAALRGALDAGVSVPHEEGILPGEERIQGQHIVAYAKQLASNPEAYQARFSDQLSRGLPPERLAEHFASVKEKIVLSFREGEAPGKMKKREVKAKRKAARKRKTGRKAAAEPKPRRRVSKKREKGRRVEAGK